MIGVFGYRVIVEKEQQLALSFEAEPSYDFDQFVVGPNQWAIDTLHALVTKKIEAQHLYYLYGAKGAGKTHLLKALCADSKFEYLDATALKEPLSLLSATQNYAIDHFESLLRDPESIFHFYNRIIDAGHTLVVAASDAPAALPISLVDLVSRLASGVTIALKPLEESHLRDLMQTLGEQVGLDVPSEVVDYILVRSRRDVSSVYQLFRALDKAAWQAKRRITIPFVKEVLDL